VGDLSRIAFLQRIHIVGTFAKIQAGGRIEAGKQLVSDLLEKAGFHAVLVQKTLTGSRNAPPALITARDRLDGVNPFVGVMPVNAAGVVGNMTKIEAFPSRTAAFLRPCETRALVELLKLKQARQENLVIIGTDCPGTYPHKEFEDRAGEDPEADLAKRLDGEAEGLRTHCRACVHPAAPWADLRLCIFGDDGVFLEAVTEEGTKVLASLGLEEASPAGREASLKKETETRQAFRDKAQKEFLPTVQGQRALLDFLSKCLRCYNCRTVCPICYCKECFFDSPTFELEAAKYLGWADARGALRMPADTLLFHLTRLNHMVHSCVACGMCSQACPSEIDVGLLFSSIGRNVQKMFEYEPGRNLEDEIPLSTFREDELEVFGGK